MLLIFAIFMIFYTVCITYEVFYSKKHNLNLYKKKDSLVNITLGSVVVATHLLFQGFWILGWSIIEKYSIFKINDSILIWVTLFIFHEFVYYWIHRFSHSFRILWAIHVNHHSSKLFNFTTASRLPVFMFLVMFVFWSPLILLGFSPYMVFVVSNTGFMLTAFQHTTVFGRVPFLEYIFVSPSHHKVHHASNPEYINRNFGAVLIIFDRLFGTFKEESVNTPIEYGLTTNIKSENPIKVIFHEWIDIFSKR